MGFNNVQQHKKTQKIARTRQLKLADESIDALQLFTLLPQIKFNLILLVNVEKQPD